MAFGTKVSACKGCGRMRPVEDYYADAYVQMEPQWLCDDCTTTYAEEAWERGLEDYYGGSGPMSLSEQCQQARKVK